MTRPFGLSGRVALVTGGGRGIGAATVTRLAEAGAKVVIANRTLEAGQALAGELLARGLEASAVPLENLDRTGLGRLVAEAVRSIGVTQFTYYR